MLGEKVMRVYIDNRERSLMDILTGLDVSYISKTLDIGDIDVVGPNGQRFLFERKTLPDLAASLRDGRFKSQKDRLLGVLQREPSTAIAYVLEGYLGENNSSRINGRVTIGTIRSLLNTIQLRYRIPVITTRNIKGTGMLIQSICKQLETKPEFCPIGSGGSEGCAGHADIMPSIKKNTKRDNSSIWISMLTALQGVSNSISSHIVSHFESLPAGSISSYIREHTDDDFLKELQGIRINNRRIGKKIIRKLVELFYSDPIRSRTTSETSEPSEPSEPSETSEPSESNIRRTYHPGIDDIYVYSRSISPDSKN